MIRRLHILCPVCIICLAVLISCVFALNSSAALDGSSEADSTSVSYSEDSWAANRIAVPAAAQETSAVLTLEAPVEEDAEVTGTGTYEERDDFEEIKEATGQ